MCEKVKILKDLTRVIFYPSLVGLLSDLYQNYRNGDPHLHTISSVLDTIYRHSKKGKPNTGQIFTGKKSARTFISPYQHLHYPIIFQIYLKNSVLQRTLFLKAITVIYVMNFKKKFCDFRSLWRNCDIDKASS